VGIEENLSVFRAGGKRRLRAQRSWFRLQPEQEALDGLPAEV